MFKCILKTFRPRPYDIGSGRGVEAARQLSATPELYSALRILFVATPLPNDNAYGVLESCKYPY